MFEGREESWSSEDEDQSQVKPAKKKVKPKKTSPYPTRVYSYGALPPAEGLEVFNDQLWRAHCYQNLLIDLERKRLEACQAAEAQCDKLSALVQVIAHLDGELEALDQKAKESRKTAPDPRIVEKLAAIERLKKDMLQSSERSANLSKEAEKSSLSKARAAEIDARLIAERGELKRLRAESAKLRDDVKALREENRSAVPERRRTELAKIADERRWHIVDLSILRALYKWAKIAARKEGELETAYARINKEYEDGVKVHRNDPEVVPFHGTYLKIEESIKQARKSLKGKPPRKRSYDGSGRCVVQIRGGLTVRDLLDGSDTNVRLMPATPMPSKKHPSGFRPIKDSYRTLWIRLRSDEKRRPVWGKFPIVLHRPLPDDARVMWAWVQRRKVGLRSRYECQLAIESATFESMTFTPAATEERSGTVVVDIGARVDASSGTRFAAVWKDSCGNSGEVSLPAMRLSGRKSRGADRRHNVPNDEVKVQDVDNIRSKHFDNIRMDLVKYRAGAPEWYQEATQYVDRWRAPNKVARLFRRWQRHDGDKFIYESVEAFLKKDRHLFDWTALERRGHALRRRDLYRRFAASLSKYSKVIVAERVYVNERRAPDQAPASEGHEQRVVGKEIAPGELCALIKQRTGPRFQAVNIAIDPKSQWATGAICDRLLAL